MCKILSFIPSLKSSSCFSHFVAYFASQHTSFYGSFSGQTYFFNGQTYTQQKAGADASFVEAPRDDAELIEIGRKTEGYRVCNMLEGGITPLHTPQELKAMGFHIIVHPLTTLYASARAMIDILKVLKESGSTRDQLHKLATFEEFNKLIDLDAWSDLKSN